MFFNINMQAQMARDQKKMQRDQKEHLVMIRRMYSAFTKMPLYTSTSNPVPVEVIESEINNDSTKVQSAHEDAVNVHSTWEAVMDESDAPISTAQAENATRIYSSEPILDTPISTQPAETSGTNAAEQIKIQDTDDTSVMKGIQILTYVLYTTRD